MERFSRHLALLALLGSVASQARAQVVGASLVVLTSTHEPLGSPLVGGQIIVGQDRTNSPFSLQIRGTILRGHASRVASPCAGLIPPVPACAVQPLRDDGRIAEGSVGAALRALHAPHADLFITTDVAVAQFRVDSRPKTGGDPLVAEKLLVGAYIGAKGRWFPFARLPLGVEASVAIAGFRPLSSELIPDGYTPFEGGLSARRISIGISWRFR